MAHGKGVLAQTLAKKIESDLTTWPDPELPSAATLSRKYRIGRLTVLRALRTLRAEGKIDFRQGSSIRIRGRETQRDQPREKRRAGEDLSRLIEEEIIAGRRGHGHALPKYSYFASEYSVSPRCVGQALKLLGSHNLIHKKGRAWIVGPTPVFSGIGIHSGKSPPTILILQKDEGHWPRFRGRSTTGQFVHRFEQEAAVCGIILSPVLLDAGRREFVAGALPSGPEEIARHIAELGGNYLGTLAAFSSASNEKELPAYLGRLLAMEKPVAMIDTKSLKSNNPLIRHSRYAQCSVDPVREIDSALGLLCDNGHKSIGVLSRPPDTGMREFINLFIQRASAHAGKPNITVEYIHPDFWARKDESPFDTVRRLSLTGIPHVRKLLSDFIEYHPGYFPRAAIAGSREGAAPLPPALDSIVTATSAIAALMKNPDISAIIPCGSFPSRAAYFWFRSAGIKVPQEISLLSFGKDIGLSHPQISSISTGMESLAFSALHYIVGDLRAPRNKNGTLVARHSISHRHSVAAPRSKPLALDLQGAVR